MSMISVSLFKALFLRIEMCKGVYKILNTYSNPDQFEENKVYSRVERVSKL